MIKWLAFFMALIALLSAADEHKVNKEFESVKARLNALERGRGL